MFDISVINKHIFRGGVITELEAWSDSYIHVCGDFPAEETESSECRFFRFSFTNPDPPQILTNEIVGAVIDDLEVNKCDGGYSVKFSLSSGAVNFVCRNIDSSMQRYKGTSYRNMYDTEEYNRLIERQKYVLDEKYFSEREKIELPEGYVLETAVYGDTEQVGKSQFVTKAALVKCALKHGGETVHEWISTYSHPREFTEFIQHSNGHKYYPFHVDLYGISFLELDTLKVFNYVPEGYQHDYSYPLGESFIITDLHYDINTDLIAFGGCFWAGTSDVMVMKLPNPLDFEMKMAGIHDIVEPDWDIYDDIDFAEWQGDKLLVTAYENGNKVELATEIAEIEKRLG